ncbi:LysR family transcriptional regulator [Azotosporobacter soli]|uniref:LysR family transcriptional regulator n=1 Tax=Azotosporobacter soli TaxID=3055040 RepID=UPI0031FF0EA6
MEFRQLQAFSAVARSASFTKAAEFLGYAQSSITTQVQLLEQELEMKLFDRLGKRVVLTENGRRFLPYAKQILSLAEQAKGLSAAACTPRGTITIGAPESLCATRLPLLLQEYHARYPAVKIILKMGAYKEFQYWLKNNQIDIAFFFQRSLRHSDFVIKPLTEEEIVAVAKPGYRRSCEESLSPAALAGETLILGERDCSYRVILEDILAKENIYPETLMELDSVTAILQCAKSGLGIAFLPRFVVEKELARGELADLKWSGEAFATRVQMGYHKDKWISSILSTFIEVTETVFIKSCGDEPACLTK